MQLDDQTRADLEKGIEILRTMLAGADPDPDLLNYIGMLCQSLSEDFRVESGDASFESMLELT